MKQPQHNVRLTTVTPVMVNTPPSTFDPVTSCTYHTTMTSYPTPQHTFGIYDSPQNHILGIANDTIPAFFFFDVNNALHHILPKITYQLTNNASLPYPTYFQPAYPEPEIVDAFIVNKSRFVVFVLSQEK